MSQEVVKSPMVTERWVEVLICEEGDKSGKYFRSNIYPGDNYSDRKKNLRIDLKDDGQLVCEVDFWNANKRRKPKIWLLTTDTERVETFMPFQMRENGRFEIKRRTYLILFKSTTRRLGVNVTWTADESPEGTLLYYSLGNPVATEFTNGKILWAAIVGQTGIDIVPGMVVSDFKPEARIISVEGNRAIVSADPAEWPKEEE